MWITVCKNGIRKDVGKAIFVFGTQGDVLMTFSTSSTLHFQNICLYIRAQERSLLTVPVKDTDKGKTYPHLIRMASSPSGSLRFFPRSFPFFFFFMPFLSFSLAILPFLLFCSEDRCVQFLLSPLISVTVDLWCTLSLCSLLCHLLHNHTSTASATTASATPMPTAMPTTGHSHAGEPVLLCMEET